MVDNEPLVTIITPVYNTEKYLAACIESVLSQTYQNWEYVIVDNCSTDGTNEIAQRYSKIDSRIRLQKNTHFLDLMQNWNHAIQQISPQSIYCKIVHADDWLFPECVSRMVQVAERNPTVGIVGSYRLDETHVNLDGLPYPNEFTIGSEICRRYFLEGLFLFGSPTSLLIRSKHIRERNPFYNESNIHADLEVCIDILTKADFGFVHQVLTYTRRHNESETTFTRYNRTYITGAFKALKQYGREILSDKEYEFASKKYLRRYYNILAASIYEKKNMQFWDFHKKELRRMGCPLNRIRLYLLVLLMSYNKLLNKLKISV